MTKVTDYIGNKVYEQGVLKKILVDGGYIEDGKYYFTLQDHLGNTRMVLSQEGSIVQREYYYPFGMTVPHIKYDGKYPYRYNGKELDQMHRLDLYDYSARYYDQAIGRFTTVDPHAENYYNISPYAYVANNPLKYIDPDGREPMGGPGGGTLLGGPGLNANIHKVGNFVASFLGIKDFFTITTAALEPISGKPAATFEVKQWGQLEFTPVSANDIENSKNAALMPGISGEGLGKLSQIVDDAAGAAAKTSTTASPNVEKVLKSLNELKSEGGTITSNKLKPTQELNLTIEKGAEKINMRVETHVVDKKFGGNGTSPEKHMNVDYFKNGKRKTNDHTILE